MHTNSLFAHAYDNHIPHLVQEATPNFLRVGRGGGEQTKPHQQASLTRRHGKLGERKWNLVVGDDKQLYQFVLPPYRG